MVSYGFDLQINETAFTCGIVRESLTQMDTLNRVEAMILYCWNRDYPADVRLDWDLTAFQIAEAREFPGRSHPRITRTIYVRTGRTP